MDAYPDTAANLAEIRRRICGAAETVARNPDEVTLVAVAKTHPAAAVTAALAAQQRVFGENRVQEAAAKYPELRQANPGLRLHLIGPLQSNKVKEAVQLFDAIETVDREKLARALVAEMIRQNRHPQIFIQINIGEEPQKAGVAPRDSDAFLKLCRDELGLDVAGLMCIPPIAQNPAPYFALLREIGRRNGIARLSMGMSGDFETAIRFGATHVRVGTAIFGTRESR